MEINFIPTPKFKKSFKRLYKKYPSLKEDYEVFKKEFTMTKVNNPQYKILNIIE